MDLRRPARRARSACTSSTASTCRSAGAALLVANRGLGVVEPLVLVLARAPGRSGAGCASSARPRSRSSAPLLRKLGAHRLPRPTTSPRCCAPGTSRPRPLAPTWLARPAPASRRARCSRRRSGFPVIPVAVPARRAARAAGAPVARRRWASRCSRRRAPQPDDQLAAAELARSRCATPSRDAARGGRCDASGTRRRATGRTIAYDAYGKRRR